MGTSSLEAVTENAEETSVSTDREPAADREDWDLIFQRSYLDRINVRDLFDCVLGLFNCDNIHLYFLSFLNNS